MKALIVVERDRVSVETKDWPRGALYNRNKGEERIPLN